MSATHLQVYLLLLTLLIGPGGYAQTCVSTGNGNWNASASWNCDGTNRVPTCGDTIMVQSGHEITVTNQNNYEACGSNMVLDVSGNLRFTNGNKVQLPCGSLLSIQSSGTVYKSGSGGGSSTLISICGTVIWRAADGTLNGPFSSGGFILPVELISFSVHRDEEGNIEANWKTATEIHSDFFTIQVSDNIEVWRDVISVPSSRYSSQQRSYAVSLGKILPEGGYVRLVETDLDGKSTVVAVTSIDEMEDQIEELVLFPNPSKGVLNIKTNGELERVTIFNMKGHKLYDAVPKGPIDLVAEGLFPGIYLVSVQCDGITTTHTIFLSD